MYWPVRIFFFWTLSSKSRDFSNLWLNGLSFFSFEYRQQQCLTLYGLPYLSARTIPVADLVRTKIVSQMIWSSGQSIAWAAGWLSSTFSPSSLLLSPSCNGQRCFSAWTPHPFNAHLLEHLLPSFSFFLQIPPHAPVVLSGPKQRFLLQGHCLGRSEAG